MDYELLDRAIKLAECIYYDTAKDAVDVVMEIYVGLTKLDGGESVYGSTQGENLCQ